MEVIERCRMVPMAFPASAETQQSISERQEADGSLSIPSVCNALLPDPGSVDHLDDYYSPRPSNS